MKKGIYTSELDNRFKIYVLDKTDITYDLLYNFFFKKNFGGIFANSYNIIIDGENKYLDEMPALYDAIIAHEIGHKVCKHFSLSERREQVDLEIEADKYGIDLLLKNNKKESADILIQRLKDHYDIDYNEEKFSNIKKYKDDNVYIEYTVTDTNNDGFCEYTMDMTLNKRYRYKFFYYDKDEDLSNDDVFYKIFDLAVKYKDSKDIDDFEEKTNIMSEVIEEYYDLAKNYYEELHKTLKDNELEKIVDNSDII